MSPPPGPSTAQPPAVPAEATPEPARWFAEEIMPHERALRAFLHRKYPTLSDVDDVVQESFLKAFLAWQKGKLHAAKGFLFTVAGNAAISLFRKQKFISGTPVNELPRLSVLDDDADVVETVCTHDELALVAEAIAGLPERCREVVRLRVLRGLDYPVIAAELGISEQTVRVQVARGMKKCAQFFRDRGILDES